MKKYIIKICIFFFIIVLIDFVSGIVFGYLGAHVKGGDNFRNNYIMDKVNEDILIFGSSRALHHYNPAIVNDLLGLSCYNVGQDGMGIIVNYARYKTICKRYHPKIVIYDIMPGFDLLEDDKQKYLKWLRPYYDYDGISEVFEDINKTEKYKMQSQLYRYNTNFGQLIIENIRPIQSEGIQGFRPLNGEMDTLTIINAEKNIINDIPIYDSLKLAYLRKMIEATKDTKIIFVMSPWWNKYDTTILRPIKLICADYNIPFIDFSNDLKFLHHNEFFKDASHLNSKGADEFTKFFVQELKMEHLLEPFVSNKQYEF